MSSPIKTQQKKAARLYSFEGYSKKGALEEAGYSPSYIQANATRIFNLPEMVKYLEELEQRKEDASLRLWAQMLLDAPEIYKRYKQLAEKTDSNDVKRRIYADILDRTGFKQSKKIDISDNRRLQNVDEAIKDAAAEMDELGIDVKGIINGTGDRETEAKTA